MASTGIRWTMKLAYLELLRRLPDRTAVTLDYFRVFGVLPNLNNPHRFSEKLQHWKLNQHDPRMPDLVDKVKVKDIVANKLGENWIIPTLWHGAEVTPAVLRSTPKPAVMKANHSSAQILFLDDKTDDDSAAQTANDWLGYDHHLAHREWAYGEVKREILIEPFIGENGVAPDDYKFWIIDGAVRFIQIDHGRFSRHTRQFYTPGWKRLDLRMNYPAPVGDAAKPPPHLEEMLRAALTLSEGFRFARVDLYDTATGPLFGEMTFAPEAGLCRFEPNDFDLKLGESWAYPKALGDEDRLQALADAFRFTDM